MLDHAVTAVQAGERLWMQAEHERGLDKPLPLLIEAVLTDADRGYGADETRRCRLADRATMNSKTAHRRTPQWTIGQRLMQGVIWQ